MRLLVISFLTFSPARGMHRYSVVQEQLSPKKTLAVHLAKDVDDSDQKQYGNNAENHRYVMPVQFFVLESLCRRLTIQLRWTRVSSFV